MVTRAGVPESAFYEVFDGERDCVLAAFEEGLARLSRVVDQATGGRGSWRERLRVGLVAFLGFLDAEPVWGRLLILETPIGDGAPAFDCQQRVLGVLTQLLDDRAPQAIGEFLREPMLSAEFAVGGVVSVIRQHMLKGDSGPLVALAPSLMAFIVAPYLGEAAAQSELEGRPTSADEALASAPGFARPEEPGRAQRHARAGELPIRATHRTTLVLRAIARAPYANNREVAHAAGLGDEGQMSKLLARLERHGVIENVGVGAARGEPNAWLLTESGRRAVELLASSVAAEARCPGSMRARGSA